MKINVVEFRALLNKFNSEKDQEKKLDYLKKILEEASVVYYNGDIPLLTDEEFDKLFQYYIKYRQDYRVGAKPSSNQKVVNVGHKYPELVGTTTKQYDIESVEEWLRKADKKVGDLFYQSMIVSLKYDGNSVVTIFDGKGKLKLALTRGEEGKGADVTKYMPSSHIKLTGDLNSLLENDPKNEIAIKNEALVSYKDWEELRDKGYKFVNPRMAASALLSSPQYQDLAKKYLTLVPIEYRLYLYGEKVAPGNRKDRIDFLQKNFWANEDNKKLMHYINFANWVVKGSFHNTIEDIKDIYNEVIDNVRDNLPVMIDGLVIEFDDKSIRDFLGRSGQTNNFDTALKFPFQAKKTHIKDIKFYIGNTGRITPVAVFEDIQFNGATMNHVSLANYERFNELQLAKGDEVVIEYHGDVLSYLEPSPTNDNDHSVNKPIPFIKECPVCHQALTVSKTGAYVFCDNIECPSNEAGRIVNFLEKLNVKGIKNSTIKKLVDTNLLHNIEDLFTLKESDIETLPGFGKVSASKIISIIRSIPQLSDSDFFGSMAFPNISTKTFKRIFKEYTLSDLKMIGKHNHLIKITDSNIPSFKKKLLAVDGIGDINTQVILWYYNNNYEHFNKILDVLPHKELLSFKEISEELSKKNANRKSLNFVFSGFRDKDLQAMLEEMGHEVKSGVTKKVDYLVVKNLDSTSTKITKAKELNIPIITVDQIQSVLV